MNIEFTEYLKLKDKEVKYDAFVDLIYEKILCYTSCETGELEVCINIEPEDVEALDAKRYADKVCEMKAKEDERKKLFGEDINE